MTQDTELLLAGLQGQLDTLRLWERSGDSLAGWKVALTSGNARDLMGPGFRPFGYVLASGGCRGSVRTTSYWPTAYRTGASLLAPVSPSRTGILPPPRSAYCVTATRSDRRSRVSRWTTPSARSPPCAAHSLTSAGGCAPGTASSPVHSRGTRSTLPASGRPNSPGSARSN